MLLDISILPQTCEELFYVITKRIPYLCGFWRFANAYVDYQIRGVITKEEMDAYSIDYWKNRRAREEQEKNVSFKEKVSRQLETYYDAALELIRSIVHHIRN